MKKLLFMLLPSLAFADGFFPLWNPSIFAKPTQQSLEQPNPNSYYIGTNNVIQNPYVNQPSGGGTLVLNSFDKYDNIWEKLFTDGTYNIYSGATTSTGSQGRTQTGTYNGTSSYGVSGFAQTGHVAGFAFGAGATVMNPFYADQINGKHVNDGLLTPTNQQIALTQAYVEYQHSNVINADIGYIGINNSPWLTGSYFTSGVNVPITYQGALVNINPGAGWLLTAIAFNGIQTSGTNDFTGETLYNKKYGRTRLTNDKPSNGTFALGSDFKTWNNNYDLRLWAYQFDNFGTLLYGDNSLNVPLNQKVKLNFAAQVGHDSNFGTKDAYGDIDFRDIEIRRNNDIQSTFVGGQLGATIDWFNITISANSIFGPSSALGNGVIISPYTTSFGSDPL